MSIIQGTSKAAGGGYTIDQSIRFNDDDSAYLTRAIGAGGNTKTGTISLWVKRANLSTTQMFFSQVLSGRNSDIRFASDDTIQFYLQETGGVGYALAKYSSSVYRDVGSWYHIYASWDTTQSSPEWNLYVNGVAPAWSTDSNNGMSQNADIAFFGNSNMDFGRHSTAAIYYTDAYLAEINCIEGSVVAISEFAETNATTGQWVPIKYTGSYGTNGFYITGENSASLGTDYSGNGNNFTSSGLTSADQMLDTPTDNFCTLNPIEPVWGAAVTLSDGNLALAGTAATPWNNAVATFKTLPSTGKWIWASKPDTSGAGRGDPWIVNETGLASRNNYVYVDANGWETTFDTASVHTVLNNGSSRNASFSYGAGDFSVVCFDADSKKLWFGVYDVSAGTLQFHDGSTGFTGDPGAGTNPTYTLTGNQFSIGFGVYTGRSATVDFGQSDLLSQFTAPTGFQTLCTANLSDPTIADPTAHFDTSLWAGNSTDGRAITGYNFQPDLVWIKARNNAYSHNITDAVRGAGIYLQSNTSDPEVTGPGAFGSTLAFTSDGFTLDNGTVANYYVNETGTNYVGWAWKANGSGSSNTDGSVTSTVSSNTTAGFSIATFQKPAADTNETVGHGLGVTPAMTILKWRSGTGGANSWYVWHQSFSSVGFLRLQGTDAFTADTTVFSSAPSSTVVNLGTAVDSDTNTTEWVMYNFAEVEGFSKFGSYVGNGSSDGTFVYCGFRPAMIICKKSSAAGNDWVIFDNQRDTYNVGNHQLKPNTSDAELSGGTAHQWDFVSNGFKFRSTGSDINTSGATYIFAAFAESPFATANAR